jgi:hypothetical protein
MDTGPPEMTLRCDQFEDNQPKEILATCRLQAIDLDLSRIEVAIWPRDRSGTGGPQWWIAAE